MQSLQNLKLKVPELLDRLGLSDVALIEKHLKPLLSARTTKFFQHRGKVTGKRLVSDNDARLKALDMAFKLRGSFVQPDPKLAEPTGVKYVILDMPRPDRTKLTPMPNITAGMTEEEYRKPLAQDNGSSGDWHKK